MIRFQFFSILLHAALISTIFFSGRDQLKPIPRLEVIKVSLAPLPQPKIFAPEMPSGGVNEAVVEKTEEKAPPAQDQKNKKTPTKSLEKAATEGVKRGLPDIQPGLYTGSGQPKIYTGSGRGFTYSYYLNILLDKIGKNWHNPFKGKDVILKSIVYFEVDKNGNIYNVRIEEDSGNELYNETAMRAVIATNNLPALPAEFTNDYLKVHLEFLSAQ
jgi:TonB family protein